MPKETIKEQIERELRDFVEGRINKLSTTDSFGGTRYLRPDRTNDRVYREALEEVRPLTKYERSIVRGLVDKVRMERNAETARIRRDIRTQEAAANSGRPFTPQESYTVTARVYEKDQNGNLRSTVVVMAGLEVPTAAEVMKNFKANQAEAEASILEQKYLRYSFTKATGPVTNESIWTPSHAQLFTPKGSTR